MAKKDEICKHNIFKLNSIYLKAYMPHKQRVDVEKVECDWLA